MTSAAMTVGGTLALAQRPGTAAPADQPPAAGSAETPQDDATRLAGPAQSARSTNNLKYILLAFHNYHERVGHLPAEVRDNRGEPLLSWRVAILPFLGHDELYSRFNLDEPWDSAHNLKLLGEMPKEYRTGIEPKGAAHTYYQVFSGPGTPMGPKDIQQPRGGGPGAARKPAAPMGIREVLDGTSNTLAVVEAGPPVPWTKPADLTYAPGSPLPEMRGPFANVLHAALLDGSCRRLSREIDEKTLRLLIVANDGELTPDLSGLSAPVAAVTPEEKDLLRRQLAENRDLVEQLDRLLAEQAEILRRTDYAGGDLYRASEQATWLREELKRIEAANRRLRSARRDDR